MGTVSDSVIVTNAVYQLRVRRVGVVITAWSIARKPRLLQNLVFPE